MESGSGRATSSSHVQVDPVAKKTSSVITTTSAEKVVDRTAEHSADVANYENELLPLLPADVEGTAWKKGRMLGGWSKVHLVLKGTVLSVLREVGDKEPSRLIFIEGYTAEVRPDNGPSKGTAVFNLTTVFEEDALHKQQRTSYSFAVDAVAVKMWVDRLNQNSARVNHTDFQVVTDIGTGAYGTVQLVRRVETNTLLALKTIPKDLSAKRPREQNETLQQWLQRVKKKNEKNMGWMLGERSALQLAGDHPYLVGLRYAFQDEQNWFLVLDYVPGGDLFDLLYKQPMRCFKEDMVRMWAAQLVCALEHLHSRMIVHRDLKLENLLLDLKGHVHLADFGFARCLQLPDGTMGTTGLFCGTQFYVAPEMLLTPRCYDTSVDWWSLGVIIFELLTGTTPFFSRNRDHLYSKIVNRSVRFPRVSNPIGNAAKDFILQLLQKKPHKRLGYRRGSPVSSGLSEIRRHPFFKGIDWAQVEAGTMDELVRTSSNVVSLQIDTARVTPPHSPSLSVPHNNNSTLSTASGGSGSNNNSSASLNSFQLRESPISSDSASFVMLREDLHRGLSSFGSYPGSRVGSLPGSRGASMPSTPKHFTGAGGGFPASGSGPGTPLTGKGRKSRGDRDDFKEPPSPGPNGHFVDVSQAPRRLRGFSFAHLPLSEMLTRISRPVTPLFEQHSRARSASAPIKHVQNPEDGGLVLTVSPFEDDQKHQMHVGGARGSIDTLESDRTEE